MSFIDLEKFKATPLTRDPFDFIVVPGFLRGEARDMLNANFPDIPKPGSYPVSEVVVGAKFQELLDELQAPAFKAAVEEKFGIDLTGRPTMVTVRGRCQQKDGRIHTDTDTKLITILVYMNQGWENETGRLRLLRSADDLNDMVAEVPPEWGTLLGFRRSDNSYHGHEPFVGERRAIQLNWVTEASVVEHELARHRMSARLKQLNPFA
jgi:SM-20-related protein